MHILERKDKVENQCSMYPPQEKTLNIKLNPKKVEGNDSSYLKK